MGCLGKVCRNILVGLLSLLKVGISIAIIIIVTLHLYHFEVKTDWNRPRKLNAKQSEFGIHFGCLMMGKVNGDSVCVYTYAVCGLSMLLSLLTSILLCVTCDLCGVGDWLQFVVQVLQTAWWIIASIIITKNVRESNEFKFSGGAGLPHYQDGEGLPKEGWRVAVAIMCWVNAGIAAILALVFLVQACKCLRDCCSCCCGDDDDGDRRYKV